MSSQITFAQLSNIHPSAHLLGTCSLIDISICAIFEVYPNRIIQRHPIPLQVRSHQSAGGRSKRTQEPSKDGSVKLNNLHMQQGSSLLPIFSTEFRSLHSHHCAAHGYLHTIHSFNLTLVHFTIHKAITIWMKFILMMNSARVG